MVGTSGAKRIRSLPAGVCLRTTLRHRDDAFKHKCPPNKSGNPSPLCRLHKGDHYAPLPYPAPLCPALPKFLCATSAPFGTTGAKLIPEISRHPVARAFRRNNPPQPSLPVSDSSVPECPRWSPQEPTGPIVSPETQQTARKHHTDTVLAKHQDLKTLQFCSFSDHSCHWHHWCHPPAAFRYLKARAPLPSGRHARVQALTTDETILY